MVTINPSIAKLPVPEVVLLVIQSNKSLFGPWFGRVGGIAAWFQYLVKTFAPLRVTEEQASRRNMRPTHIFC